jgi:hypothetical protein
VEPLSHPSPSHTCSSHCSEPTSMLGLLAQRGDPKPESEESSSDEAEEASSSFYSRDQVLSMDLSKLRRILLGLGLPTSGSIGKLQARALAISDALSEGASMEEGLKRAKALR